MTKNRMQAKKCASHAFHEHHHHHHDEAGLGKTARNRIHNITGAQVQALIAKLDVLLPFMPVISLHELLISSSLPPLPSSTTCSSNCGYIDGGEGKHGQQEASILNHLRRSRALTNETLVAIELGAGTARLSERLQRETNGRLVHVLVDRQTFHSNQSRDRAMAARVGVDGCYPITMANNGTNGVPDVKKIQRHVSDIASFDLSQFCNNSLYKHKCLCMSKHLCGPASDIAISAMSRLPRNSRPSCALATCCHYLCVWESFVGRDFWIRLGLSRDDFIVAVAASQWATLKREKKDFASKAQTVSKMSHNLSSSQEYNRHVLPNLAQVADVVASALASREDDDAISPRTMMIPSDEFERTFPREEKALLGNTLKQLLDISRAAKLQELGYSVELVRYTTRSMEDRLLVASIS